MEHPMTVLEAYGDDLCWNDNSMLAICCDFIQLQGGDLMSQFEKYVASRAAEESDEPSAALPRAAI